jgi:CYTH domain-containing protein
VPGVMGAEVTDDDRYYNEHLALAPISTWNDLEAPHLL